MRPLDEVTPPTVTITLSGEYDIARADELRDAFLVPLGGAVWLTADMTDVTFVDSTGLGALITAHTLMAAQGVTVRMTEPTPAVRRVFEVTGVAKMFGL